MGLGAWATRMCPLRVTASGLLLAFTSHSRHGPAVRLLAVAGSRMRRHERLAGLGTGTGRAITLFKKSLISKRKKRLDWRVGTGDRDDLTAREVFLSPRDQEASPAPGGADVGAGALSLREVRTAQAERGEGHGEHLEEAARAADSRVTGE